MIIINKPMIYMMVMMIFDNDFVNDGDDQYLDDISCVAKGGFRGLKPLLARGKN